MDIIAFVKPKREVIYVFDDTSVQEALHTLEQYRYTSIPIINREGFYVGTISEGDFLWEIKKNYQCDFDDMANNTVSSVHRHRDYSTVDINAGMDELIVKAADQNFVPIVDDKGIFIGIVTRKTILNYFFDHKFVVL